MSKRPPRSRLGDQHLDGLIGQIVDQSGLHQDTEIYRELVCNIVKLGRDKPRLHDLKLITRAFRELRVANRVFAEYRNCRKVSVFGSARTAPERTEYKWAEEFGQMLVKAGFMVITGAGHGIMGAAQKGAGREKSFGLNILLPFEQSANETIQRDAKLITFRYFFTRKVTFVKESHAVACFPGGFGTMDEAFETLTLIQTGKAPIMPVVLIEPPGRPFWHAFETYIREHLLGTGVISESDFALFKVVGSLQEALGEICRFYTNFHSYRFVGKLLSIRLHRKIPPRRFPRLARDAASICMAGKLPIQGGPLPEEADEPELAAMPRILLPFNRRDTGGLRRFLDALNEH